MRAIDLTGRRVGRWTVVERLDNSPAGGTVWLCRCDCGNEKSVDGIVLRDGRSQSCGCLRDEKTIERSTKHGHTPYGVKPTPTYHTWAGMKARCSNKKHRFYPRYGGRGIKVCARWRKSFAAFLEDMGEKPPGMTIERENRDGNYEPGNCVWATQKVQARNKSNNRLLRFAGESMTLGDWATKIGVSQGTLAERLDRGWPLKRALTEGPDRARRSTNRMVAFAGREQSMTEWARELGIPLSRLVYRLNAGWALDRALSR